MVWDNGMGMWDSMVQVRMYVPTYVHNSNDSKPRVVVVSNLQMRMYVVRECGLYGLYSLYVHVTSMMYVWCTQVCKCKE